MPEAQLDQRASTFIRQGVDLWNGAKVEPRRQNGWFLRMMEFWAKALPLRDELIQRPRGHLIRIEVKIGAEERLRPFLPLLHDRCRFTGSLASTSKASQPLQKLAAIPKRDLGMPELAKNGLACRPFEIPGVCRLTNSVMA